MTSVLNFSSSIDPITIAASDKGISCVHLGQSIIHAKYSAEEHTELLLQAKQQILEYLQGTRKEFHLPLDWDEITGFQRDVLSITANIPFGEVITYGQVAKMLGKPNASRAVGGALSRNPMPIIIPCHRVIAASGALTGYTGANGIETKILLLRIEGQNIVGKKLV